MNAKATCISAGASNLVSVTHSDFLLQWVGWVSIASLVILLLLLLKIVRLRVGLIEQASREQHFLEIWRPLLAAAIDGEKGDLPPLAREDEIFFLKLWNHLHESLRGKARKRLNILALRCGMMEQAYSLLRKKDLRSQLMALTTLGHLGDRHDWGEIMQLARHPDPLLSITAARALFQIDADAALNDLKRQLLVREDWPTAQLTVLIQEAATENTFAMLASAAINLANSTGPAELGQLMRLLHLLEAAPHQRTIPVIRAILSVTTDDETIAQCLRFLSEPNDLPFVRNQIGHPNWIVRLQAARALGRIGTADDLTLLATLLGDPVWWVRYRTAQALMELTHGDSLMLSELRAHLTDPYALDMLEMVAAEKETR